MQTNGETTGGADRIAVMIDADNTRPSYADEVLSEVAKQGNPTIRRVYGDFTNPHLNQWARKLNRLGLRAMHQNAWTTGKNSTDLALVIDAMDLLYDGNVEAFALVTSDSDFTSLAHRLRESGKKVYVLGEGKAPESLRNACDQFIDLTVVAEARDDEEETESGEATINLQSALTRALNAVSDDEGWASLGALGNQLTRTYPSFDARAFGNSGTRLSTLVADQPYLETTGSGNAMRVRRKGAAPGRAKAKAAEKAPEKASEKTPDKAVGKAADKTPEKTPEKTPQKTPQKAPVKSRTRNPVKKVEASTAEPATEVQDPTRRSTPARKAAPAKKAAEKPVVRQTRRD